MKPSLTQKLFFITLCTLLGCYIVFSKRGIREYLHIKDDIDKTKQNIVTMEATIESLKEKIVAWKKEDFEQEKLARQELNMGFTNELVYKVPSEKKQG